METNSVGDAITSTANIAAIEPLFSLGSVTIGNVTVALIISNLFIATLLGLFVRFVYGRYFAGVLYQDSFGTSIVLIALITCSVIMVIAGNLILSLGLVGALSIVRFRSAIKDPLDIVYFFWAVCIGISVGVSQYVIAIVSTLFIAAVIAGLFHRKSASRIRLVVLNYTGNVSDKMMHEITRKFERSAVRSSSQNGGAGEVVIEVSTTKGDLEIVETVKREIGEHVDVRVLNYYGTN